MPLKILPRKCASVAKEGKVFEPKKLLIPLLDTSEGTKNTCISLFLTSPTPTVYSTVHSWQSSVLALVLSLNDNNLNCTKAMVSKQVECLWWSEWFDKRPSHEQCMVLPTSLFYGGRRQFNPWMKRKFMVEWFSIV